MKVLRIIIFFPILITFMNSTLQCQSKGKENKVEKVKLDLMGDTIGKTFYPRVVYNKCTNVYAVRTSSHKDIYWDFGKVDDGYFYFGSYTHIDTNGRKILDTSSSSSIGSEIKFNDSTTAINTYRAWKERVNRYYERLNREQAIKDSIEKCMNTYN